MGELILRFAPEYCHVHENSARCWVGPSLNQAHGQTNQGLQSEVQREGPQVCLTLFQEVHVV